MIGSLYVNEIPARALQIIVNDDDGIGVSFAPYDVIQVHLLDPRNNEIDTTGGTVLRGTAAGSLAWILPTDRSLFTRQGEYVVYLELINTAMNIHDFAGEHTIQVRRMGGRR